jgi:hypothetical protein
MRSLPLYILAATLTACGPENKPSAHSNNFATEIDTTKIPLDIRQFLEENPNYGTDVKDESLTRTEAQRKFIRQQSLFLQSLVYNAQHGDLPVVVSGQDYQATVEIGQPQKLLTVRYYGMLQGRKVGLETLINAQTGDILCEIIPNTSKNELFTAEYQKGFREAKDCYVRTFPQNKESYANLGIALSNLNKAIKH